MLNVIWLSLIVFSIVVAALNGRIEVISQASFEGAKTGVTVSFGLLSVLIFWLGMMKIAEKAGLLELLAKALSPVVQRLFPDIPKGHPALGYILSNMSANLLGLGNAATPMGIKAMEELQKLNPDKQTASPAMCTLLAINTASITLIPTTMIAIRMQYGSANPVEIVGTTLIASFFATLVALLLDRWYRHQHIRRKR
ncbi:MAG: spore maturation protein [Brevibacillus sp.]|nr:spore maturation protein [Brevibacillus sp.]